MTKWADYLISKVNYDSNHLITFVMRHKDTDKGITAGILIDRKILSSDIKNGLSHITIYNSRDSWKKGYKIKIFSKDGNYYLRIDENKVKLDYLGDLPEAQHIESKQKPTSSSIPKPDPEPKRPKGALPKESSEELSQELDLAPEPIAELDEDVTEQLLRLEQLEKQILELESKPAPEPIAELDEDVTEQLLRLEQLEKQILELESKPKTTKPKTTKPKTTKPKTTKPKTTKPKTTKPKTTKPKTTT